MPLFRLQHALLGMLVLSLSTLNLHAERIITLSPSITEIVFALGRGNEIVGVSEYVTFPKEATVLPKVGGYFQPNIEVILSLRPTLVLAQPNHADTLFQIEKLGIKTQQIPLETIEQIKDAIVQLGDAEENHGKTLLTAIDKAIQEGHSPRNNMRVIIVFGLFEELSNNIYISGKNLFFNEIIEICGASNAFESSLPKQPVLNYESLIALNPDKVIILNTNHAHNKESALKSWYALPISAAKNNAIHVLEEDFIAIPSHRISQSISSICKAIHD